MPQMIFLLFLAFATPTSPLKPWTHDICEVRQAYATDEYLTYCKIASPNRHPACPKNDPTGYANHAAYNEAVKQSRGKGVEFEFWDCSWHPRKTARR